MLAGAIVFVVGWSLCGVGFGVVVCQQLRGDARRAYRSDTPPTR
jgi:hypothetical protein